MRAQRNDHGSPLSWPEQMTGTLRECPEISTGSRTHLDVPTPPGVLAHRADDTTGALLSLHNLDNQDATADHSSPADIAGSPAQIPPDRDYGDTDPAQLAAGGYGYRRIRLH